MNLIERARGWSDTNQHPDDAQRLLNELADAVEGANKPKVAPAKLDRPGVDAILSETYGGEPFFTLRGQDAFAPALVTAWAILAAAHGAPAHKVSAAFAIAKAMDKWPNRKHPD